MDQEFNKSGASINFKCGEMRANGREVRMEQELNEKGANIKMLVSRQCYRRRGGGGEGAIDLVAGCVFQAFTRVVSIPYYDIADVCTSMMGVKNTRVRNILAKHSAETIKKGKRVRYASLKLVAPLSPPTNQSPAATALHLTNAKNIPGSGEKIYIWAHT